MGAVDGIKNEMKKKPEGVFFPNYFRCRGYEAAKGTSDPEIRAEGIAAVFTLPEPFIYKNDLIAGSIRDFFIPPTNEIEKEWNYWLVKYPERSFATNFDHFAPDYYTAVKEGIPGLLKRIDLSLENHRNDPGTVSMLKAMRTTLEALALRLKRYAEKARSLTGSEGYDPEKLLFAAENCEAVAEKAPETFAQGLQLVWMIHNCFVGEGRYAMALGRIDRYLYPLYEKDVAEGRLTDSFCRELLANVFAKICEFRYRGFDDVVNIAIGGVDEEGKCSVNGLSYCALGAVKDVNMPGPNLSARIPSDCPDEFLDECLKVIGTGLGYPALMNDDVNMAALLRKGYDLKDVRDYCMVGCIENFIAGKQPPWVDGRFDPLKYMEAMFNDTPPEELDAIESMDDFMEIYEKRLEDGAAEYAGRMLNASAVKDPEKMTSPFLSCFCDCCITRGLDVNCGGARYPSAHGAALMGIGTVSDSLAAINKIVFDDKFVKLSELGEALRRNFEGYGALRARCLEAPKYGNNLDYADRYAVWYTSTLSDIFDGYRTHDGGPVYTIMASNISNIYAGKELGATPDGRLAGRPLSDAASPTYGCDKRGVTSTILSVSKPDYTRCACGTVLNQKFSPSVFKDGKREKLAKLIRVYFSRGGQEIQINSTSREILEDARLHPEKYSNLVVRVSGFSAVYITLAEEVKDDILARTQHEDL